MIERELDGTTTQYDDVPAAGDTVERLLTELFSEHWAEIVVGPLIEGAAWEIRLTTAPTVTMLDGYMTVDTGPWHFHLCVGEHRGTSSAELARIRRVARAAFFHIAGGTCAPGTWGLRLWNGRGEQMVTVLFPNPHFDADFRRVQPPRWERTALWDDLRRRYAARAE
jgi:hypothetical protein